MSLLRSLLRPVSRCTISLPHRSSRYFTRSFVTSRPCAAPATAAEEYKKTQGTWMSYRRYKLNKGVTQQEVTELCGKEFVPLLSRHPGFIAYYATISGKDEYFSVSVFSTESGAHESIKIAQDWTDKHLANKIKLADSIEGHTVVQSDAWTNMHSTSSTV